MHASPLARVAAELAARLSSANPAAIAALPLEARLAIVRLGRASPAPTLASAPPPPSQPQPPPPPPPPPPARVFIALARTLSLEDVAALPTTELADVLVSLRSGIARGGAVAVNDGAAAAALAAMEGELAQRDDLGELGDDALADAFASVLAHVRSPIVQRLAREIGRRGGRDVHAAVPGAVADAGGATSAAAAAAAAATEAQGAQRRPSISQPLRNALWRSHLASLGPPRSARAVVAARAVAPEQQRRGDEWLRSALAVGAVLAFCGAAVSLALAATARHAAVPRPPPRSSTISRDQYLRFRARALGLVSGGAPPLR